MSDTIDSVAKTRGSKQQQDQMALASELVLTSTKGADAVMIRSRLGGTLPRPSSRGDPLERRVPRPRFSRRADKPEHPPLGIRGCG